MRSVPVAFSSGTYAGSPERSNFLVYACDDARTAMRALRSAADPVGSFFDSSVGCDCDDVCADAGSASARAAKNGATYHFFISVLQFPDFSGRLRREDRQVAAALLEHRALRVAAQHIAHEFADVRGNGLAGRAVEEDGDDAREGIAVVHDRRL